MLVELGKKVLAELLSLQFFDRKPLFLNPPLDSHIKNKLDWVVVLFVAPFWLCLVGDNSLGDLRG